jgi:hypothetical protein
MILKKVQRSLEFAQPDECETPSSSEPDQISTPYPNKTESSSSTSDLKKVETEGEKVVFKEGFKETTGDEESGDSDKSETGFLTELLKTKVLGLPLGVWGLLVVAFIIVLWIWHSSRPIEPLEYMITM